jgi:hypothetical protein
MATKARRASFDWVYLGLFETINKLNLICTSAYQADGTRNGERNLWAACEDENERKGLGRDSPDDGPTENH